MQTSNKNKVDFWNQHLLGAEAHGRGIGAYCEEHGLSKAMYYKWKKKLQAMKSVPSQIPSFLPVKIKEAKSKPSDNSKTLDLPDARWVAEVITHLIRGLK